MSVNLGSTRVADIVSATEGTGGTSNYNDLINKPQINGVTLTGNLTTEDLNIDTGTIDAYTKSETDNLIDSKIAAAGTTKADKTYVDTQLSLKADKSAVETSLASKANTSDVYTKEETSGAISSAITGKADTSYVDTQLGLKADKSTTYTKTEVDNSISSLNTNINGKLNNKADKSTTYTKEETAAAINTAITGKADTTYVDGQLANKADKSDTYTKEEVDDLLEQPNISGDTLPIGTMILWSGTNTPQNWLLCDGREVSRETYNELFAIIGTTWGAGDGSTSFNLPNYTDRFPIGAGGDVDLAETGGEKEVTLTVEQIPSHSHTLYAQTTGGSNSVVPRVASSGTWDDNKISSTGGGQAHNNMPPYTGSYYIIKAKQSAGVVAAVVDTLESTSKTDALSANMGKKLGARVMPVTLFDGDVATDGSPITLSDNYENYEYIEVYATTTDDNDLLVPVVKVLKGFNKFQIVFNTSPSTGWMNMNVDFSIFGNTITPTALRQVYINSSKSVERVSLDLAGYGWNLHIRKVLGYK